MPRPHARIAAQFYRLWRNDPLTSELCRIGTVVGSHGLQGELKVRVHPGDSAALLHCSEVWLGESEQTAQSRKVRGARIQKGLVCLALGGCDHVSQAGQLMGQTLYICPKHLPSGPERPFFFELAGLVVEDRLRGTIGVVEDMFTTAAHPILVVQGSYGEVLIPALPQFVACYDLDGGRLLVNVPEGLFPEP